jgi:hypothetical protein
LSNLKLLEDASQLVVTADAIIQPSRMDGIYLIEEFCRLSAWRAATTVGVKKIYRCRNLYGKGRTR